jgi:hypothetical protein
MRVPVIAAVIVLAVAGAGEAQTCLHGADESESQRRRVGAAITFIREVSEAQSRMYRQRNSYVALSEAVSVARVPVGFVARLRFDRWSYGLMLKDSLDSCGFALFSDQEGVIYEGRPTDRSPQPSSEAETVVDEEQ